MLDVAGGTDVVRRREAPEPAGSRSKLLLARAPDVILEVRPDEGWTAARLAQERDVWKTLASVPAIRNGRLHIIADQRVLVPGPRVVEGVGLMFEALHK